jgi:DNA mismatch repair protein MutS
LKETPMIRQYREIKEQNQDKILLFRVGDFYEMFYDDARVGARELDIALTSRETGKDHHVPLAGFPYHALETYLARLIEKGCKVAICEQVEDPKLVKGLVRREIVRVITPGTVTEAALLEDKANNYLVSVYAAGTGFGLVSIDVSTGDFFVSETRGARSATALRDELCRLQPAEIITAEPPAAGSALAGAISQLGRRPAVNCEESLFRPKPARKTLLEQFGEVTLEGLGLKSLPLAAVAAGAAVSYLSINQKSRLSHLRRPRVTSPEGYMALDAATRRNLELTGTIRDGGRTGSLLWVLDKTRTAMGARTLKRWLEQPLLDLAAINRRLDAVEELAAAAPLLLELGEILTDVYDLERLMARVSYGSANARDLLALKNTLKVLPQLRKALAEKGGPILQECAGRLPELGGLVTFLESAVAPDPPLSLKEGGLLADGFNSEVDRLRRARRHGREDIAALEQKERERTGIKSLKVGYNKVFGYYLEVTRPNVHLVPVDFIRKQTLANAERYLTPELKEYEEAVLGAEEKVCALEYEIFLEIRARAAGYTAPVQQAADVLAEIDVFASLARVARENRYVRPLVHSGDVMEISGGRHPVVEKVLGQGRLFVANDTLLDSRERRILVVTGPNMAGKSTYMRQTALIALLAQAGSFVPAKSARIGLVDRIFTRIGAADDLVGGQSTFMLEMNEVAGILLHATHRSLVLLDEVGRGTSTFDGLCIARAVVEYIYHRVRARTLFATHYHELTGLAQELPGVFNLATAVREKGEDIIFLHKVIPGSVDRSYGIQVARLAGLPPQVIERAKNLLSSLESASARTVMEAAPARENSQLQLFVPGAELQAALDALVQADLMTTTPLEAMQLLYALQLELKKE